MKGIGKPEYYLGGNFMKLDEQWNRQGPQTALSAETYISNIIPNFEANQGEFSTYKTPMDENYYPELD